MCSTPLQVKYIHFVCHKTFSSAQRIQTQQSLPEEILAQFGSIFSPVANISLNISVQFPQACEIHLLWSDCFTLPKHRNGNNDLNDPTNEWRSHCCISILLLRRKLGDFIGHLVAAAVVLSNVRGSRGSLRGTL